MADDLIAVPAGELRRSQQVVRNLTASTMALWAVVLIVVLALLRKRVITWPDLAPAGWHG